MADPRVVILGAGPAGLGAALRLRESSRAEVVVLEQGPRVGGNAGSFTWRGHRLDFGSHRLHHATSPRILADIHRLLGDDLRVRPRHGRIHLRGRWIHFPLRPLDLLLRLDPAFALGALRDMAWRRRPAGDDFASVLEASLGPTICRDFYFPYARKIWGTAPERLSGAQAHRRVSANSFGRLLRKVLGAVPGFRPPMAGRYYYPADGFGQISEAYAARARELGADLRLETPVTGLQAPTGPRAPWIVHSRGEGEESTLEADHVWSTLPIPVVARLLGAGVPSEVQDAAARIRYRGMILVYLEVATQQFTPYDAHYFPGEQVRLTRLSEPRNYAARAEPEGRTVLCAELPTNPDEPTWSLPDAALADLVAEDLARVGLPLPSPPVASTVRRLSHAYPIYDLGYEQPFGVLDRWAESLPRFLTFGRQGLFAHDNTHHALAMAYGAVDCLAPEGWDADCWAVRRGEFARHVVED